MVDAETEVPIEVPIEAEADIVRARSGARDFARAMGFGPGDQSRITTAVSELARNVVRYATDGRGHVRIQRVEEPQGRAGIEVTVADNGPGIENLDFAMRDGASTSGSLGLGLPGTRRLMDEMLIETASGSGTTITIRKWLR